MDDTQICNMALSSIGTRSTIASLSENSPEAATCQLWYATLRDGLLRGFPWNWARRQITLAVYKSAAGTPENPQGLLPEPPRPWRYEYAWPSDCLDARYILPLGRRESTITPPLQTGVPGEVIPQRTPPIKFLVAGDLDANNNPLKVILTNKCHAELVYVGKVYDSNVWDIDFVTALVGRLAENICFPLSGDKTMAQIAIKAGAAAEARAEANNGNEALSQNTWDPDWLVSRGFDDLTRDGDLTYMDGGPQDIS